MLVLTSHTLKVLFSLVNYSSVTTFIHFFSFFFFLSTKCQSSLSISSPPAFLKSNGSSLSALSPRRVKREMKTRLIAFYACQLNAYFIHLDQRKKKEEGKVRTEINLLFYIQKPEVLNQMRILVKTDVFDLSKLLVTLLN